MLNRVNREELLAHLESVQAGLSPREIIEQSSCFVFKEGEVFTYNDEVACRAPSKLPMEFTGAVQAEPLLKVLRKLPEDEVEVAVADGHLIVIGKKRNAGVRMEADIQLPVANVETPGKWRDLHEDFADAVSIVQECAGKDESAFVLTCVHVHPNWLEACDNFQLTRYKLKTGTKAPFLVRRDSLKHITALGMTELSEGEKWVHFRNPAKLTLSCRRFVENYSNLDPIIGRAKGEPTTLPKGLGEAAEKAEIFSSENADDNQVQVEMRPGKLRVKGQGSAGWYSEVKEISYNGPAVAFMIKPGLLVELAKRHNECAVSDSFLKVDGGKFVYVACLGKPAGNGKDE